MNRIYSHIVIAVFAMIFFVSGIGKLLEPAGAVNALIMLKLSGINYNTANVIIFVLSNVEIALALLILTKRFRAIAMRFVLGVLVFFLVFLVYVKTNGIILDECGCFGGLIKRTIPEAIIDEIVLLLICSGYFIINRKVAPRKAVPSGETQRKLIIEKI